MDSTYAALTEFPNRPNKMWEVDCTRPIAHRYNRLWQTDIADTHGHYSECPNFIGLLLVWPVSVLWYLQLGHSVTRRRTYLQYLNMKPLDNLIGKYCWGTFPWESCWFGLSSSGGLTHFLLCWLLQVESGSTCHCGVRLIMIVMLY